MNKQDLINNFVKEFSEVFPNANTKDRKLGSQMVNFIFDSIKSPTKSSNLARVNVISMCNG